MRDFEAFLESSNPLERKLTRAVARLRRLGISRGAAERFEGETLFDDVLPDEFADGDESAEPF
jgi:hypothetical protein